MTTCETCNGTGWQITERGATQCACVNRKRESEPGTPIDAGSVSMAVKALQAIAFFPVERAAQTIIGDALVAMCPSVEALRYVVRRACAAYPSWEKCGIKGLRQIVCSKFQPKDGIESGPTEYFPEGLPSEKREPLALPPGAMKALPPGHTVSADTQCERMIEGLAKLHDLNRVVRRITKREHSRPTNPNYRPITQAEIDAAVKSNREKLARAEILA